jgi:hypothetical protein
MAIRALLFAIIGLVLCAPAAAMPVDQTDMSAYYLACTHDPALAETLQFAQDGMEAGRERFCSCMVSELQSISQADAEIYAKFVEGTMTDADRMKHETFEDLHAFVVEKENTCMVIEGFADGYDPATEMEPQPEVDTGTNFVQLDTDGFYAACINTNWDDSRINDGSDLSTLCDCLVANLEPSLTQHELDTLTAWYNGEIDFDALPDFVANVHENTVPDCMAAL